jgi:hypothetical protein
MAGRFLGSSPRIYGIETFDAYLFGIRCGFFRANGGRGNVGCSDVVTYFAAFGFEQWRHALIVTSSVAAPTSGIAFMRKV